MNEAALQAMLDREAIRDCCARLARGEDRRDANLIRTAYWPDSRSDYGVFEGSFDEYLAWVVPGADAITNTQHVLGQSHIELEREGAPINPESRLRLYPIIGLIWVLANRIQSLVGATLIASKNAMGSGELHTEPCSTTGIRTGVIQ